MNDDSIEALSKKYVDDVFGEGFGDRHMKLVSRFDSPTLRDGLHRAHAVESRTDHLSLEENYLIGMCVLCASGHFQPAAMFAKTLLHLGVDGEKIFEATARLEMWVGTIPAATALGHIQRAVREYERDGIASMKAWFPEGT